MAKGKNIAYVRISPADQSEAGQREALQSCEIDKWFIDKVSGKDANRPQLQKLLDYICKDDAVYVVEFSCLGRSTSDLLSIVQQIEEVKEKFDTKTPAGKLQMIMMAAIAEFEHAMILERQREGIAIAKRQGKYKGTETDFDSQYR